MSCGRLTTRAHTHPAPSYPLLQPFLLLYYTGFEEWSNVYESGGSASNRHEAADERIKLYDASSRHVSSVEPDYQGLQMVARGTVVVTSLNVAQWIFVAVSNVDCELSTECPAAGAKCVCDCEDPPFCQGPLDLRYVVGQGGARKHRQPRPTAATDRDQRHEARDLSHQQPQVLPQVYERTDI